MAFDPSYSHKLIEIFVNRKEFIQSLREDFIPYMNENGLNSFIVDNQREIFTTWTMYFYPGKIVKIKE